MKEIEGMKNHYFGRLLCFALGFFLLALLMFWIVNDDWRQTAVSTDAVNQGAVLPELTEDQEITQDFSLAADALTSLVLSANKQPGAPENALLKVALSAGEEKLYETEIPYSVIGQDGKVTITPDRAEWPKKGSLLTLALKAEGRLSFWYGQTRSAGKFEVETETGGLRMNGQGVDGELVFTQKGIQYLPYTQYYWPVAGLIFLILLAVIQYCHVCQVKGKDNLLNRGIMLIKQYRYLLKTLVVRDFKIKYRASMLGVLWSFLNPLLMTFVYMFVFSTLFRSSIENFVVYLMSGIILFNYFSEASNLGMQSIVGNAGLIKKVYMPKYIFPISKVLSSGINLCISLIPLLIMMLLTGVRFSKSLLLIPLVLLFLIVFCIGVSLTLASAMVYFRDVQFLWGILLTILNFVSPIFYPESIIPARFITIYHMNPMYQYLFFMRTITLGGISPTPVTYLYCTLASLLSLAVGLFVFRRSQSKFVLHL